MICFRCVTNSGIHVSAHEWNPNSRSLIADLMGMGNPYKVPCFNQTWLAFITTNGTGLLMLSV